jgi:hypothetical protein
MIVNVQGTITTALPRRSGVSQTGNAWAVQEFVVSDANNNIVCFEAFGEENIQRFALQQPININCVLNCREYNGKYYTSLRYLPPKAQEQQPTQQVARQFHQQVQQPIQQQGYAQPMQQVQTQYTQHVAPAQPMMQQPMQQVASQRFENKAQEYVDANPLPF